MTYLDYLEQKVLLERLVIGLEEPVLIKGLGELSAKIDSGNGGYNVIHGTDFHQQGDKLMFTTHDCNGNEKKIQAKVIDSIEINMGGGNIENRPVIELDIKFAGEDYKKIPFSVSDRSTNTNPILISKGFVENELEALIDVGATNISHEGIDVIYGEGVGSFLKNAAKGAGSVMKGAAKMAGQGLIGAVKTAASGVKNAGKWLNGGSNVSLLDPLKGAASIGKDVVKTGIGVAGLLSGPIAGILYGVSKAIYDPSKLVKEDVPAIRKMLPNAVLHRQLVQNKNIVLDGTIWKEYGKTDFKKVSITPLVSFKGRTGDINKGHIISGMEQRIKNWKKALEDAEKITKDSKSNKNQKTSGEEQEENIFREAYLMLSEDTTTEGTISGETNAGTITTTSATPSDSTPPTTEGQLDNGQQPQDNNEQSITISQEASNAIQETATDFKELSNFVLYYIPASTEKSKESVDEMTKIFTDGKLDQFLSKLFNIGQISKSSITPIIKDLAKTLKGLVASKGVQGCFAIGTGDLGKRKVELFDTVDVAVYKTKKDETQVREGQKADPEIIELAENKFKNIEPLLDDIISALNDQNVIKLTSHECQRSVRRLISKSGGDLTKERDWVEKQIGQYENNGEIPTAIIKNYFIQNGLSQISDALEKKFGKNWKITDYDDFINKIAEIDGISEMLNKIGDTKVPTPEEIKTPNFDTAEQEITSQIEQNPNTQTESQSEDSSEEILDGEVQGDGEVTNNGEVQGDGETNPDLELPQAPDDLKIEIPEIIRGGQTNTPGMNGIEKRINDEEPQTELEEPDTQKLTQPTEPQVTEEQPVDEEAPAEEVNPAEEVKEPETKPEEIKPENNNKKLRVKSRAQMTKNARNNKKAHRNKGKGKGEQEEEPWIENEEDPWIKSKLQYFRNKGLI